MNPTLHAVRLGMRRGWIAFRQIVTTADGLWSTAIWNGVPLIILVLNRDNVIEGTDLSMAVFALPGFLGLLVGAAAMGPAYNIAAEREDGTLLRARALPHGIVAYIVGVLTTAILETGLGLAILLIPGALLFPGLEVNGVAGVAVFIVAVLLGLLATLPLGVVIGSLISNPRVVGSVGMLAIGAMTLIAGILFPLQSLPTWLQVIGQLLPPYWIGVGMRFVFLPDAVALEIGGTWRLAEMAAVLALWAIVGTLLAPPLLRRMTRRASGATLEQSKQAALQRV